MAAGVVHQHAHSHSGARSFRCALMVLLLLLRMLSLLLLLRCCCCSRKQQQQKTRRDFACCCCPHGARAYQPTPQAWARPVPTLGAWGCCRWLAYLCVPGRGGRVLLAAVVLPGGH